MICLFFSKSSCFALIIAGLLCFSYFLQSCSVFEPVDELSSGDVEDKEDVMLDLENLAIAYRGQDFAESVTSAVGLSKLGDHGSLITWVSSTTNVNTNTGAVFRLPFYSGDLPVNLQATLSKGKYHSTKDFDLIIKEAPKTDELSVIEDTDGLVVFYQTGNSNSYVTLDVILQNIGPSRTDIIWTSSDPALIDVNGVVNRPVFNEFLDLDKDVFLTATVSKGIYFKTKSFTNRVIEAPITDQRAVNEAYNELRILYATGDDATTVTQDVGLSDSGDHGVSISWSSSDSHLSVVGKVTRPNYFLRNRSVELRATISKNTTSREKVFHLRLPKRALRTTSLPVRGLTTDSQFGTAVDIEDDIIAVGAPGQNSVYLFRKVAGGWTQSGMVTVRNKSEFGSSVSLSKDHLAVGARNEHDKQGAVYLYSISGGRPSFYQRISLPDAKDNDQFGSDVSLSDTSLMVGAPIRQATNEFGDTNNSVGAVYHFERNADSWFLRSKILPPDISENMYFGLSLAHDTNSLVTSAFLSQSIYFYTRSTSGWRLESEIKTGIGSGQGTAIDGDTSVYTAHFTNAFTGEIHYVKKGGAWPNSSTGTLKPRSIGDRNVFDEFGYSVDLNVYQSTLNQAQYTVIAGARYDDEAATDSGAAYLFQLKAGGWVNTHKLTHPRPLGSDHFGHSVSIQHHVLVVGSPGHRRNRGTVHVFESD